MYRSVCDDQCADRKKMEGHMRRESARRLNTTGVL